MGTGALSVHPALRGTIQAVAWEEWYREGEARARECAWPSANLWLLMAR